MAASHSSDRAKRRKSLTINSMNELGVDDLPYLPRSPQPPSSPTVSPGGVSPGGTKRTIDPFAAMEQAERQDKPTEKLECMDRTSFRYAAS